MGIATKKIKEGGGGVIDRNRNIYKNRKKIKNYIREQRCIWPNRPCQVWVIKLDVSSLSKEDSSGVKLRAVIRRVNYTRGEKNLQNELKHDTSPSPKHISEYRRRPWKPFHLFHPINFSFFLFCFVRLIPGLKRFYFDIFSFTLLFNS